MKLLILSLSLLTILIGGWLFAVQESQQQAIPEFYGFYVQSEGQLVSIPKGRVSYAFPPDTGFDRECILGLVDPPQNDFKADRLKFILFLQDADQRIKEVRLTKLTYKKQLPLDFAKKRRGEFDSTSTTDVSMWVGESEVPFQVGPVPGTTGMFRIAATSALEPGVYAIHWGSISKTRIAAVNYKFDEATLFAYAFSVNIGQTEEAAYVSKPTEGSKVSGLSRYGRMEATEENLRKLLSIARDSLKTRQGASYSSGINENKNYDGYCADLLNNLDNALLALIDALRISDSLSKAETGPLLREWVEDLKAGSSIARERKAVFWEIKSFDKERKVRLGIEKYLKTNGQ